MDDDDTWYQCKQCQDKFKTTAELQKHKRINHRPVVVVAKKSAPPPPPPLSQNEDSESEYINEGTEKLACGSCRHQFDTSDPVVLHLLRQYRNENGAFKCPYCVKVQLKKSDFLENNTTELQTSPVRNLSMRRRSRSTGSNGRPDRTSNRLLQNKRRVRKPLVESTVSASPISLDSPSTRASIATFKTSSSSSSSFRKSKHNRSFGVAYRHSEETGRSGHGKISSSPRTVGGHKRSSEVLRTKRYSDVETPLKLSVLINEEPLTNDRLAVPRAREYDKGNITCQYCGFVAKSFREVQFHINTHMAKSYPCEFCAAIYRSKQAVVKHTANHHADEAKAKQLLQESNSGFASSGNSTESEKVYRNGDSSSMTSEEEYDNDNLSDSNMDSSMMMNDLTSSSFTATSSHFQPQEDENAGTGYGFQDKYFSTDSVQYSNSQPSEFEMVDTNLEKIVELANF